MGTKKFPPTIFFYKKYNVIFQPQLVLPSSIFFTKLDLNELMWSYTLYVNLIRKIVNRLNYIKKKPKLLSFSKKTKLV